MNPFEDNLAYPGGQLQLKPSIRSMQVPLFKQVILTQSFISVGESQSKGILQNVPQFLAVHTTSAKIEIRRNM